MFPFPALLFHQRPQQTLPLQRASQTPEPFYQLFIFDSLPRFYPRIGGFIVGDFHANLQTFNPQPSTPNFHPS
jgi:hypothetical protein